MSRPARGGLRATTAAGTLLVSLFVLLVGRLGQVQLVEGPPAARDEAGIVTRDVTLHATRGRILDRHGAPLVDNVWSTTVTVPRSVLLDATDGGRALVGRVASAIGRPAGELWARTMLCGTAGAPAPPACFNGSPYAPVPLASEVEPRLALSLLERPEVFPGVDITAVPARSYPASRALSAAHVLGHLSSPTAAEVALRAGAIDAEDLVGRTGLEAQYDTVLRGTNGRDVVSIDPRGAVLETVETTPPVPGRDLLTHLDPAIQAAAERSLVHAVSSARKAGQRADSAAALVLDVTNGAVVAAASFPTYDPSVFTGGISSADLARLTDESRGAPLRSRLTAVTFPPASAFKVVSVAAAVRDGARLSGRYDCSPTYRIGDHVFHNFESRGYGPIDLHRALVVSCDTVFYRLAHAAWLRQGGLAAGLSAADPFTETARGFGLGRRTGIDLPGESTGTIPDRAWKRAYWEATRTESCRRGRTGYPDVARRDKDRAAYLTAVARDNCASGYQLRAGDAVNFSIGQGDLAVTPVQLAVVYAAVANGGTLWRPQIAAGAQGDGVATAIAPQRLGRVPASPRVLAYIRRALADVTRPGGSAGSAFADFDQRRYPLAGKTGTGEVYGKQATAWFIGYGPTTRPKYVVAVVVSQGGSGSKVAAPSVREIFETISTQR